MFQVFCLTFVNGGKMKIKTISLKNFRAYKDETVVDFVDLTTFVGKNDIGKSTVLEALDIFFNDGTGVVKLDKGDINQENTNADTTISITVEFTNLPDYIRIDAQNLTTLSEEYLQTSDGTLKICKEYPNAGKAKVSIIANHPTNEKCKDLLLKKITELKKILNDNNIACDDKTKSATIRKAIWNHYADELNCAEVSIDTSREGAKDIYEGLESFLPLYSLFRADRSNNDTDTEIQDPMKLAVKQLMSRDDVADLCNQISNIVSAELNRVATNTLGKLQQIDPTTANTLTPNIPNVQSLKWADVFKSVSINSDNEIPLNKRGSGVKRLVLISFFRAEVDRRKSDPKNTNRGVIYAIEEPETSQHVQMQKIMIDSLKALSQQPDVQVILTTHSSFVVKQLTYDNIRVIKEKQGGRVILKPIPSTLPYASLNEINFTSFGDSSEEYHNELYGEIQAHAMAMDSKYSREKEFENWFVEQGMAQSKQWKRISGGSVQAAYNVTLQTYIRNTIHHPENKHNAMYSYPELTLSINQMRSFIQNGYHS